ncbi:MAG: FHA domain-containing protein [Verrucomicrobiota bacterium]
MPRIVSKSPEFADKVFDLTGDTVGVGRTDENPIAISHPSISSNHAEFRFEGGDYRLVDLGSTNGSRVNDEKISEVLLRNGDIVMLGNILFSYESEVVVEAPPLPEAEARVDLSGPIAGGRPAEFKNLAPLKKPKKSGGGIPILIILAVLIALGGLGFLSYQLFLV